MTDDLVQSLCARYLSNGSFSLAGLNGQGTPSVDSTAWAIIALHRFPEHATKLKTARTWLQSIQRSDGRLTASPDQVQSWWPTSLAVMAWQGDAEFAVAQRKAVDFLLASGGVIFKGGPAKSPNDMDVELRGWSWINGTISWVEPTAQAILALEIAGLGDHPRIAEGVKMIMNRQLPSGGWNYGNSKVYGAELRPMPANTGLALDALAGKVAAENITHSLDYMATTLETIRAPLSVAWGLMGLRAWNHPLANPEQIVEKSKTLQTVVGTFETPLLAQLLTAAIAPQGLRSHFAPV